MTPPRPRSPKKRDLAPTVCLDDMDNLRHMLGAVANIHKRDWGYRNHFAPGTADVPSMERLLATGYVTRGGPYHDAHYYHATEAGCVAAGLSNAATRRAMAH